MNDQLSHNVPNPPKRPHLITQHGETRTDDYFWMRYREDPAVLDYLKTENGYCAAMTAHTEALQERLYQEMRGRIKETDVSVPEQRGDYCYYARTQEGQQYRTCCRKRCDADAAEEILLDQNAMAEGHRYFRVGAFAPSPNNRWLAYSTDTAGDEVYTLHLKDLHTGAASEVSSEVRIPNTTYGLAWANDSGSFFYTVLDATKRPYKVFRHVLGTNPAQDKLMHHEADELFSIYVDKTANDAYILINLHAFGSTEVRLLPADGAANAEGTAGEFAVFHPREKDLEYDVEHDGEQFLVVTNWEAVNFRLMLSPVNATHKGHWRELIPHRPNVFLQKVIPFKDALVRLEREGGLRRIRYSAPDLSEAHEVEFPEPTYTWSNHGHQNYKANTLRFTYTSLVTPNSVIDFDLATQAWQLRKQDELPSGYDPAQYQSERLWATAPDGTCVPISLIYRKGFGQPGPLLLYGYGSYGSPVDPAFNANRLSLLDRGVAFAIAHIRGGNEMGRQWYDDGKLMHKKNTFTDFIACAEHLIGLGFTSPDRLAIQGKSAGGLLVGAAMTMRPDLFCSVIADVPFVDVISTMSDPSIPLTAQEWEQWGNPANKAFYDYMKSYSPYDNVRQTNYPALLLKAGWADPRVQYWEPAKFAAKLRALKTDTNPLLLKTNMNAGHFGSSGRFDFLKEIAFDFAFVLDQFDIAA